MFCNSLQGPDSNVKNHWFSLNYDISTGLCIFQEVGLVLCSKRFFLSLCNQLTYEKLVGLFSFLRNSFYFSSGVLWEVCRPSASYLLWIAFKLPQFGEIHFNFDLNDQLMISMSGTKTKQIILLFSNICIFRNFTAICVNVLKNK